ncbi:hypothetical protein SARC_08561 [Sphaeroforma arctica JP610]|uniref:Uncharacterized protein n=1 Tax=Sphaeroforma arctica JP610 TaxID=667725 RepID=A0A0L0FQH4_9EUKA|nr:hypothetical protein SARC_08561 [Sphaeroforma arctica JP610]KNC79035.1 hypothetical protein SARC_08561 [Sphaeroforma arctica JP610]|eukprot:XP_014152937.1 hypothetical protein SARC_08561 [Sphaeroforma arctica JP610]
MCCDTFLFTFTILPLRVLLAIGQKVWGLITFNRKPLSNNQQCDILRLIIVVVVSTFLQMLDASKLYHMIRSQDTIRLYVIFNVLEILEKYCSWLGQDILDALFSRQRAKRVFIVAIGYTILHSLVCFCQVMALQVAINSYNRALLTMLVSNQFVEVKGNVFKKYGREQVYRIACYDIVERFYLITFLVLIAMRNLKELDWSWYQLDREAYLFLGVMMSEVGVDWIKHAFLSKFNGFSWVVYQDLRNDLAQEFVLSYAVDTQAALSTSHKRKFIDQTHLVSRRIGFVGLPIACVFVRITMQSTPVIPSGMTGVLLGLLVWLCLLMVKVISSITILGASCQLVQFDRNSKVSNTNEKKSGTGFKVNLANPPDRATPVSAKAPSPPAKPFRTPLREVPPVQSFTEQGHVWEKVEADWDDATQIVARRETIACSPSEKRMNHRVRSNPPFVGTTRSKGRSIVRSQLPPREPRHGHLRTAGSLELSSGSSIEDIGLPMRRSPTLPPSLDDLQTTIAANSSQLNTLQRRTGRWPSDLHRSVDDQSGWGRHRSSKGTSNSKIKQTTQPLQRMRRQTSDVVPRTHKQCSSPELVADPDIKAATLLSRNSFFDSLPNSPVQASPKKGAEKLSLASVSTVPVSGLTHVMRVHSGTSQTSRHSSISVSPRMNISQRAMTNRKHPAKSSVTEWASSSPPVTGMILSPRETGYDLSDGKPVQSEKQASSDNPDDLVPQPVLLHEANSGPTFASLDKLAAVNDSNQQSE